MAWEAFRAWPCCPELPRYGCVRRCDGLSAVDGAASRREEGSANLLSSPDGDASVGCDLRGCALELRCELNRGSAHNDGGTRDAQERTLSDGGQLREVRPPRLGQSLDGSIRLAHLRGEVRDVGGKDHGNVSSGHRSTSSRRWSRCVLGERLCVRLFECRAGVRQAHFDADLHVAVLGFHLPAVERDATDLTAARATAT